MKQGKKNGGSHAIRSRGGRVGASTVVEGTKPSTAQPPDSDKLLEEIRRLRGTSTGYSNRTQGNRHTKS